MKKFVITIFFAILSFVACIDSTSNISDIYGPIKAYKFEGNTKTFMDKISDYCTNNKNIGIKITDSFPNSAEPSYFFELIDSINKRRYLLNCKQATENSSFINLTGAFDEVNNTGGFKLTDKNVKELVDFFEINFLSDFEKKEKLTLTMTK